MKEVVQYMIDGASLGSLYALFALGIGLIFGIMQLINFAHGELIMVGGYVLVFVSSPPAIVRIGLMILVVVLLALAMERIAFRPARGARADTLLVTSFAVSFLLQSLAILIVGALPRSAGILTNLNTSFTIHGYSIRKLDIFTHDHRRDRQPRWRRPRRLSPRRPHGRASGAPRPQQAVR